MQKHPLNSDFEWQDRAAPYRLISRAEAEQYNQQGYLVFNHVFDEQVIDELTHELDQFEAKTTQHLNQEHGGKHLIARAEEITFTPHPVIRSQIAREFCHAEFFKDLTFDLLGPDVRLYWDQIVYKKPGTQEVFPWHQDNGYTYIEPQQYLTCWVALSGADETNGCPQVAAGHHRNGTYKHHWTDLGWDCGIDSEGTVAPVRKGGVVVFSSLTPHMTGPNLTDQVRKTYIVQFAPDGAEILMNNDGEITRTRCDDPDRQFLVLKDGCPISPRA